MQWVLVLMSLVAACSLGASVWVARSNVDRVSETVTTGQGQSLLDTIRAGLENPPGPWSGPELRRVLEERQAEGLRYVAFFAPHGDLIAEAGQPIGSGFPTNGLVSLGGPEPRVRIMMAAQRVPPMDAHRPPPGAEIPGDGPPHEPFDRAGPPPGWPPPPSWGKEHRGPPPGLLPPALVIEFVPHVASGLNEGARRVVVVGGTVALALLVSTAVLLYMLKQRDAMERRLEQSRQLAALGEVSAVLAHQFRNPLASLKGHAQLLSGSLPDGAERTRAERVVREARRLEELCNDLLDLVRSARLDRTETPLRALLDESVSIVDPARIEVRANALPDAWSLDATKVQQVLINVLDNAVLASPEGQVELDATVEGNTLIVRVRDHGPGIDAGEEERIFEPFHTGRATGTGLGLAVARRIVALHGGVIQASNHRDGGAVFTIEIPSKNA